jgi:hypothetical protein
MRPSSKFLICVGTLIGILAVFSMGGNSFALAGDDTAYIRKVRVLEAGDLSLVHPAGLTFSPNANVFIVLEALRKPQTKLFVITPYKGLIGVVSLDVGIVDPLNMAFDSRFSRLLLFDTISNGLIEI